MKAMLVAARNAGAPDFLQLTKPRITILVVATTLVGFYLGAPDAVPVLLLIR